MADFSELDLTACEREPIHIPGSIQPHGILIAVDDERRVVQAAGPVEAMLGVPVEQAPGRALEELIGEAGAALVERLAAGRRGPPLFLGLVEGRGATARLELSAHCSGDLLILELEPEVDRLTDAAETLAMVRSAAARLSETADLTSLAEAAAREMRRISGFDRVMIYRFLEDESGSVLAEDKLRDLPTFLNHHYPASDIPRQARALYLRNPIRLIPDVGYLPAPLMPPVMPGNGRPLDLSDAVLRSVSPVHIQYLKNMGVAASMSVSIIVDGQLWGLIACHHETARTLSYAEREVCQHLGQMLGQRVKALVDGERHGQMLRARAAREDLVETVGRALSVERGLIEQLPQLQAMLAADGAAIVHAGTAAAIGHAPDEAQLIALADWVRATAGLEPLATDSLSELFAPAVEYRDQASGLLAVSIPGDEPITLLWFRAEQVTVVEWAGSPHKPVESVDGVGRLTPRRSFEVWKETVRGRARPWTESELDGAARASRALLDIRHQQQERRLNQQLRRTLADKEALISQKDLLMKELNHRVQNSLQLVNAMLHLQARDAGDPEVKRHFDEASRRIRAIAVVHQRLWRSDHVRSVDFRSYIEELRDGLLDTWGRGWTGLVKVHGSAVLVPTDKAVTLALVVTELLTNAVKYAYDGEPGPIDVTVKDGPKSMTVVVRDHGRGLSGEKPTSGLGSRLIRSLVGQLDGEIETRAADPGTEFSLVVPIPRLAPAAAEGGTASPVGSLAS
jgi:two-component system, chemotaxis family, sensor kinase Cph1